uniref:WW domain binding protein VOPP1 n=1 Tax=Oncorhynchus tshawytscha TaxID=74940 RepID=A0A8C8FI80_ONCTS
MLRRICHGSGLLQYSRSLSIQRLWYFWLLLMMGVLFCCGAGFFIRRCMYPSPFLKTPLIMQNYGDPGGMILTPTFPYSPHPYPSHLAAPYPHPTPPAYCNLPPPPYEQVLQASEKR